MAKQVRLTTIDNPYDPFTEFDDWYAYDQAAGYDTPGLLARISITSDELSEADQFDALNDAIDEIVRDSYLGIFRKVVRN